MSISSFCLEQREKERETLKKFLAFSLIGSAVLHVVLAFTIGWLYEEAAIAEEPIEVIIVEEPDTLEPEKEPEPETPEPTPTPVATPTPQKLVETETPDPIQPQPEVQEPPPQPIRQPEPEVTPSPEPIPEAPEPEVVEQPTPPPPTSNSQPISPELPQTSQIRESLSEPTSLPDNSSETSPEYRGM